MHNVRRASRIRLIWVSLELVSSGSRGLLAALMGGRRANKTDLLKSRGRFILLRGGEKRLCAPATWMDGL